jgi:hypothetical protein
VLAGEQYLKSTDLTTASPSVLAVNTALELQSVTVPPPKVAIPKDPIVRTLDTL